MFTLNVGFLGCNGERGKEKSKVNFNFPVLQIYGRFIFSFYSDAGFCAVRPVRLDCSNGLPPQNPPSSVSTTGQRRKVLLNERAGHPDRSMDTWVT